MMKAEDILAKINDYLGLLPYDRQHSYLYEPVRYVL